MPITWTDIFNDEQEQQALMSRSVLECYEEEHEATDGDHYGEGYVGSCPSCTKREAERLTREEASLVE